MRKIILLFYILLGFACICASCQNNEKIRFREEIIGLEKIGIKKAYIGNFRFNFDGSRIVYSSYGDDETNDKVFEYDLKKGTERLIFSPKEYYFFDGIDSAYITNIFLIDNNRLIIFCKLFYYNEKKKFVSFQKKIRLSFTTDGSILFENDTSGSIYASSHMQSLSERFYAINGNDRPFYLYNLLDNTFKKYPDPYPSYPVNSIGKNLDEVFVCYKTKEGEFYLDEYNLKTEKVVKTIQVPNQIVEGVNKNMFEGIILSPDSKHLVLFHSAYGAWVFDTATDEFFNLLYTYDSADGTHQHIYVYDWSWDSKYILLVVDSEVYKLDLNKFMEGRK